MSLRSDEQPESSSSGGRGNAALRWSVYWLLIVASVGAMTARIVQVRSSSLKDPSPFLSANDRSRWCTVRALVEEGTYAIDNIIFKSDGTRDRRWHTIDLVKHRAADGREHYYSSKPTLLPTLLAGEYWLVRQVTGATLREKPFYVAPIMLVLTNVLPLALALWVFGWLVEEFGTTDWGRLFTMAAAAFGTFLTTFSITLNNHLTAGICVTFALAAAWPLLVGKRTCWWRFAAAGLLAAFTAANELPALSFFALLAAALLWKCPVRTLAAFVPAAAIVAAAAIATNVVAHGSWKTPYAHRQDGPVVATMDGAAIAELDAETVPAALVDKLDKHGISLADSAKIEPRTPGRRWSLWDESTGTRLALVRAADGRLEIRRWDNWYDYLGTYWTAENLSGVDRGEPSRAVYAFHVLVGHHGIFSLTPIWLFSLAGAAIWLRSSDRSRQAFTAGVILLTLVVLAFYLSRPLIDRNYGGVTSGLRWMFWFTPLWLLLMLPALDALGKYRSVQIVALVLLAVSVFSAHYAAMNPWSQPWIFEYWRQLGWIAY